MPADIVSLHNNVISFQIRPRQGGQAAGPGGARFACISHPAARTGGRPSSLVWSSPAGKADRQNSAALGESKSSKGGRFGRVWHPPARPSIHPFIHPTIQPILISHLLGAKLISRRECRGRDLLQPGPPREASRKRQSPQGWGDASLGNQVGTIAPSRGRA